MKVLFLDFDGVIVISGNFSQSAVANLNSLLNKEPDLKIVVSSSWRHKGLEFVKQALANHNVDMKRIVGITDTIEKDDRGTHIERYIKDNKVDKFVIFDDNAITGPASSNFVQTNPYVGLTSSDVRKARAILGK